MTDRNKRFSQANFDRHVHILTAALAVFPDAVQVDPAPRLASSFKQPCRDAINAYAAGYVQYAAFKGKPVEQLVVSEDDSGQIWVGSAQGVKARRKAWSVKMTAGTPSTADAAQVTTYKVDFRGVGHLCRLIPFLDPLPQFVSVLTEIEVRALDIEYPERAFLPLENQPNHYQVI